MNMAKISLHLQYYENETAVQKNEMINIKSLGRSFNKDRKIFGVSLKTSLELPKTPPLWFLLPPTE